MKTETRAPSPRLGASAGGRPSEGLRSWIIPFLVSGSIAVAIMAFFVTFYASHHTQVPLGWDTSKYLWRTALLKAVGFAHMKAAVPPGIGVDPGRPGFPVIAATLSAITRLSTFRLAAALPAATAAAIGLGAGAFVAAVLGRSNWEFAAIALFVGMSAFVVRLVGPETYQDNLFAAAVFVAAAIPIALVIEHRRALVPAALLFAAGGVVHWAFFLFMLATLGLAAAAYVPGSIRSWRRGERPLLDTPAARVGTVMLGGGAVAGTTILGVLGIPHEPHLSASEFAKKLRLDIPKYKFPLVLPAAAVGAGSLFLASRGRAGSPDQDTGERGRGAEAAARVRFVLTLLLAWSAVTLAGYLAFKVLHFRIPAHRFLAFALALPILAVIGIIAVGRLVARWARPVAAVLVMGALAGAAYASHAVLFKFPVWMDPAKITDATAAGAYVEAARIDTDRPLVFLLGQSDGSYTALMGHMIRASLPPDRIGHVYLFIGTGDDYLARRPMATLEGPNPLSERYLRNMVRTYEQNPAALVLASFNPQGFREWIDAHPESLVAPNVAVVKGPLPQSVVPRVAPPLGGLSAPRVGAIAVAVMALLAAIGLGWAVLLLGSWLRPLHVLAVSPAIGIAALVLAGVAVDRLGVRLAGVGGILALVLAAASGWLVLAVRRVRTPG